MNDLSTIVKQIAEWQTAHKLSDNELLRRFGGLGSTKTYKRILAGDTSELDVEKWAADYAEMWTLMEMAGGEVGCTFPLLDDLEHMARVRHAVASVMQEVGNNRLVIVEGEPGTGKTASSASVRGRFAGKMIALEADETWSGRSTMPMLCALFQALRVREERKLAEVPMNPAAALAGIVERMQKMAPCVALDEAHHMGAPCLNLIKTMINRTPSSFIMFAKPDLFRKLETRAFSECQQLTQNRLKERIRLDWWERNGDGRCIRKSVLRDVEKVLTSRLKWDNGSVKQAVLKLATEATGYGHWNFVDLVTHKCRELVGADGVVDAETFVSGLRRAAGTR